MHALAPLCDSRLTVQRSGQRDGRRADDGAEGLVVPLERLSWCGGAEYEALLAFFCTSVEAPRAELDS